MQFQLSEPEQHWLLNRIGDIGLGRNINFRHWYHRNDVCDWKDDC